MVCIGFPDLEVLLCLLVSSFIQLNSYVQLQLPLHICLFHHSLGLLLSQSLNIILGSSHFHPSHIWTITKP